MTLKEQIEAASAKATGGPWRKGPRRNCDIDIIGKPSWPCKRYGKAGEWDVAVVTELDNTKEQAANAALIVTLVNAYRQGKLIVIEDVAALVEALEASKQGWDNVVEMGLLPRQHYDTAHDLSERARTALAKFGDTA